MTWTGQTLNAGAASLRIVLALLLLADCAFVARMIPAASRDGSLGITLALCAVFGVAAMWVLVRPNAWSYAAALVTGLVSGAVLALAGFIGQMGADIGSPGTSNVLEETIPYVALQVGIAVAAGMLTLHHAAAGERPVIRQNVGTRDERRDPTGRP